jgi:molybdopterin/thiamine biosynthesis adenylyltransferase
VSPVRDDQVARYARQVGVAGWGEAGQRRLAESHVFVAGVGGLGCAAAVYLAAAGVGTLTLCDSDRIDLTNLNRQVLYTLGDVGMEKAPTAAGRLSALNPGIRIEATTAEIDRLTGCDLIGDADVVLDCLDNLETRLVLGRCSIEKRVPMVHAAVSEFTGHLSFLNPPATPCLECFISRVPPPAEPAIPGAVAGFIGALEAMEAIKHIIGIGDTLAGRLLIAEGLEPRFDIVTIERDPGCPACRGL